MSKPERSFTDPKVMQRALEQRLTRRSVLKGAGVGAAGFSLASLLAACGGNGGNGGNGSDAGAGFDLAEIYAGEPGDTVNFTNWPFYIDQSKDKDGNVFNPSLKEFTKDTGISVTYEDTINSNEEFFGKIQPILSAGDDPGFDIMVITNGRYFSILWQNGWVYPLDPSRRPNFDANATSWATDPFFDPGNQFGMAWQSGVTGIGVNNKLVNGEITKLDDLANPDKVGNGLVGMLEYDMPDFVMINLGIDPKTSGPDEWKEAAAWLQMQKESGTVRAYYGNDYLDELRQENLSVSMAWSGDVLYSAVWLQYDMDFVVPEGGALLWIDNMMIPAGAQNPVGAMEVMDYYYDPKPATMVAEWVLYMTPVKGVADLITKDADQAVEDGYKGYANKLYQTAQSDYLFPDDEFIAQTSFGFDPKTDEEIEEWDSIFLPISQS